MKGYMPQKMQQAYGAIADAAKNMNHKMVTTAGVAGLVGLLGAGAPSEARAGGWDVGVKLLVGQQSTTNYGDLSDRSNFSGDNIRYAPGIMLYDSSKPEGKQFVFNAAEDGEGTSTAGKVVLTAIALGVGYAILKDEDKQPETRLPGVD